MRPEDQLHESVVKYLRAAWPDLLFSHTPNQGMFPVQYRMKLKRMGLLPGWPDLTIIMAHGRALFIELKTDKGRLSDAQKKFRDEAESRGALYFVARSIREVETIINEQRAMGRIGPQGKA